MNKTILLVGAALFVNAAPASAYPLYSPAPPDRLLLLAGPTDCQGPIATEDRPIRGVARLAQMRRSGRLPDRFVCGRCEYSLAGDPEVAYYVRTCR